MQSVFRSKTVTKCFTIMISVVRFCIVENICSRSISYGSTQIKRQSRMLDRMLKKKLSQEKAGNNVPGKLKQEILQTAYDNEGTNRKTTALNKFYMEQLSEQINSGPFSNEVTELGIEFTKVKITPCRSSLHMYWIPSKPDISESAIAELLRKLKKELQTNIGFLRSMQRIPFITFVKDLRMERQNIIERLLEVADFGTECQPESARKVVNPELSELKKTENAENLVMRQNVLGLDHAKIKEKVMKNVKRFQPINVRKNELQEITDYEQPGKLAVFSKKLFTTFYKRKVYLDKKLRTREYDDSFGQFNVHFDPEEEADKYWECFKFKDDFNDKEQELEMQDCRNLMYDDDFGKENDDYCEERDIEDDNGDELGNKGEFNEKK